MGDGETLEAAASSSFVQHASTIAEAKVCGMQIKLSNHA